jgi:signal transduction histidine kinase
LLFFPTANSFFWHEKIGAIEALTNAVIRHNVKVRALVPLHPLIEKVVEQNPFLLQATHNKSTDRENNNNIDSIRYIQEISGTRATILVIDKSTSLVTGLEDNTEQSFDAATAFSTYSTDLSMIFPYISIFENLWTQAGLYQQVKKVNEKLIMQDKKYKEFISVAAHELRTPIQPIIGLSYLLKYEKESLMGKEEESLDIIMRNAERLSKLTENILDLTKIENGKLKLKKEIFDLDRLIYDTVSDFEKQLADHHEHQQKHAGSKIELRYNNQQSAANDDEDDVEIDDSQFKRRFENNVEIEADKDRIYQVISNLINNAIKSIDDGTEINEERTDEIIVSVSCANKYQHPTCFEYQIECNNDNYSDERYNNGHSLLPDTAVIVSITDTGRGIDLGIMPKLFKRFATNFKTGTGLGLFISKSIIEAHKGKIWAYNNKGRQGATFQFSLPLKSA